MFLEVYDTDDHRLLINIKSIAYIREYDDRLCKIQCNDSKFYYIILKWEDLQYVISSRNLLISLLTVEERL
jgi:hypothetical protein